ncbi:MAG: YHS domain-containing protein [Fimbriimonadales bacterium]|nr:YHS domain-containing protein [Armatimonadota bacterium]MCX7688738.1 YHS domain-containing protein [Fimbriimonadales bacterium]GBC91431.1 hypothetical protein HRbin14_02202 [bacterium HR14]CUU37698.1 YHS domain-containing protein [Armatimonadetes bacterium DC]
MRIFGLAVAVFAASFVLSAFVLTKADASTETRVVSAIRQTPQACPVCGETVSNTVRAPRYMYAGTLYYFCCAECREKFRAAPATYARATGKKAGCCGETSEKAGGCCGDKSAKAAGSCCSDKGAQPAATQASKPADKLICPVSGEELDVATAVAFEYNGKTYYTCCNSCKSKFLADPETYAKKAESISALQGKPATK